MLDGSAEADNIQFDGSSIHIVSNGELTVRMDDGIQGDCIESFVFDGRDGNDLIFGGDTTRHDDTLIGGEGNDRIYAGLSAAEFADDLDFIAWR